MITEVDANEAKRWTVMVWNYFRLVSSEVFAGCLAALATEQAFDV